MNELLLSAYRYHRQWKGSQSKPLWLMQALAALIHARADAVNSVRRYAPSPWAKPVTNGSTESGCRWIENPAVMGLRFVGYCDVISDSIRHTGWFTDPFQESKIRGCVYQLPGRGGKARFVAAHDNEDNGAADCGGPAYVDFSTVYQSDFKHEMFTARENISKRYVTPAIGRQPHMRRRRETPHAPQMTLPSRRLKRNAIIRPHGRQVPNMPVAFRSWPQSVNPSARVSAT